jgi:hypothetical protein
MTESALADVMNLLVEAHSDVCKVTMRVGAIARSILSAMLLLDETFRTEKSLATGVNVHNFVVKELSRLATDLPVSIMDMVFTNDVRATCARGAKGVFGCVASARHSDGGRKRPREEEEVVLLLSDSEEEETPHEGKKEKEKDVQEQEAVFSLDVDHPSRTNVSVSCKRKMQTLKVVTEEDRKRIAFVRLGVERHKQWVEAFTRAADEELRLFLLWTSGDEAKRRQADAACPKLFPTFGVAKQMEENMWGMDFFDKTATERNVAVASRLDDRGQPRFRYEATAVRNGQQATWTAKFSPGGGEAETPKTRRPRHGARVACSQFF